MGRDAVGRVKGRGVCIACACAIGWNPTLSPLSVSVSVPASVSLSLVLSLSLFVSLGKELHAISLDHRCGSLRPPPAPHTLHTSHRPRLCIYPLPQPPRPPPPNPHPPARWAPPPGAQIGEGSRLNSSHLCRCTPWPRIRRALRARGVPARRTPAAVRKQNAKKTKRKEAHLLDG